jgi:hypothetical protein
LLFKLDNVELRWADPVRGAWVQNRSCLYFGTNWVQDLKQLDWRCDVAKMVKKSFDATEETRSLHKGKRRGRGLGWCHQLARRIRNAALFEIIARQPGKRRLERIPVNEAAPDHVRPIPI